jgi:hypothetical protein
MLAIGATIARADSMVQITTAASQGANDAVAWSSAGANGAVLSRSSVVRSNAGATVAVRVADDGSVLSTACPGTNCGWKGGGFTPGDRLLWLSDTGIGGTGPIVLTFPAGVVSVGATVQPDVPGPFTVRIEAFNGDTSLGSFRATSDNAGNATYVGVRDSSGPRITSVTFSVDDCVAVCADFAIGTVLLDVGSAQVSVSPSALSFAQQLIGTMSAPQAVTLTNSGNATAPLNVTASGDFSAGHYCGSRLNPGTSCTVFVRFAPTDVGTRSGVISFGSGIRTVEATGSGFELPRAGDLSTDDAADRLHWTYEPQAGPAGSVSFRLCEAKPITWWKGFALFNGGTKLLDIGVENRPSNDAVKCTDYHAVPLSSITVSSTVELWKAKFLGIHTRVKTLSLTTFGTLRSGGVLTVTWLAD